MIIRPLEAVLAQYPDFQATLDQRGWHPQPDGGLVNPRFGEVKRVVVCANDGKPIYDQWVFLEHEGAIVIPYDTSTGTIRLGFIREERPIIGKTILQFPMGLARPGETAKQAALRELREEAGLEALTLTPIGNLYTTPVFFPNPQPLYAAQVATLMPAGRQTGDRFGENIEALVPYSFADLLGLFAKNTYIECAQSEAAITRFGLWKPEFYLR